MSKRYPNPDNVLGLYILDDDGNPVEEPDVLKWGEWLGTHSKHVAYDELPGGYRVSTVFLGVDHKYSRALGGGPPVLFETMAFKGDDAINEDWAQRRYTARWRAEEGHGRMLIALKTYLRAEGLLDDR